MSEVDPELRDGNEQPQDEAELTFRAVAVGLGIGLILCFTNTYFGLQSGWISMMSLQASLLGFAVFKVIPHSPLFSSRPLTVHENIVLQTTAVATGTLPLAAGLVGIIPALSQLEPEKDNSPPIVLSGLALCAWCFAVAFFGVFLAVPLRRQVIVKEKLVFPSGTATAQIISVLHKIPPPPTNSSLRRRRGDDYTPVPSNETQQETIEPAYKEEDSVEISAKSWTALSLSFMFSVGMSLLSLIFPVVYAIPLFDLIVRGAAHDWLWWLQLSPSYIGQGIIMGFPTCASMNLGMITGWLILSPLAKFQGWANGPVASSVNGSRGWILWPALGILLADAILSFSIVAFSTLSRSLKSGGGSSLNVVDTQQEEDEQLLSPPGPNSDEEANFRLVVGGVFLSCVCCVFIVSFIFGSEGIQWWATVIALGLASIFSILGVRALGETDLNPVSAIGKASQLLFAFIQPNNVIANLIAGGISEAGAQQAGDLMQDLKTGHLHGASPKAQFYGQLIGSLASVFASSGIYILYRNVYELPSTAFPVPTAAVWLNLARLVNSGELPPQSKNFMIFFGIIFFALSGVKMAAGNYSRSWTQFIPSAIAFSIGFINTPSFSLARLIGGIISLYVTKKRGNSFTSSSASHLSNISLIVVASGFVLGEGLASIVGLLIKSAGAGPLSCFGCHVGGGGYCASC